MVCGWLSESLKFTALCVAALAWGVTVMTAVAVMSLAVSYLENNRLWITLAYLFLVSIAGYRSGRHAKHVPNGKFVVGVSILVGTATIIIPYVTFNVVDLTPTDIIPYAVLMVTSAMTVTGGAMERLNQYIEIQMNSEEETALALAETPRQATNWKAKRALVIALSPVWDHSKTLCLVGIGGSIGGGPTIPTQIFLMSRVICASTISSILSTYLCLMQV